MSTTLLDPKYETVTEHECEEAMKKKKRSAKKDEAAGEVQKLLQALELLDRTNTLLVQRIHALEMEIHRLKNPQHEKKPREIH